MANIKCGRCHNYHSSVQEVRDCHMAFVPAADPNAEWAAYKNEAARLEAEAERRAAASKLRTAHYKDATEKQLETLNQLAMERGLLPTYKVGDMDRKQASDEISRLIGIPKTARDSMVKQRRSEPEDGIYVFNETGDSPTIYKVYKMVHGSGRQGLKRLQPVQPGSRKGQFRYIGLASKNLPWHARKMTIEEAKEFGKLYGFCVVCGRTLTDEISIANGIGPICGSKGW